MIDTQIMDGKKIAGKVLDSIAKEVDTFTQQAGRAPGLAVIHAGADPASSVYVKNKEKACQKTGIEFTKIDLPEDVAFQTILDSIDTLNNQESCDGLIVQLPLPSASMDENEIIQRISVAKDVDGFHPETIGNLWSGCGDIAPCTPAGVMVLLKEYGIELKGKRAVIVGRSNIVGKPMAALLLREHATVTIAHSRTQDLPTLCQQADILIAAVGRPGMIQADHIKPGAVVIDVGINRITTDEARAHWLNTDYAIGRKLEKRGHSLIGDVDPIEVMGRAAYYTPVPGGVGRMTVAMLLNNTITLAKQRLLKTN